MNNNNFLIAMTLRTIELMIKNEMYAEARAQLTSLSDLLENESN
jgi:hypothetical protein